MDSSHVTMLRRSTRVVNKPTWINNFLCQIYTSDVLDMAITSSSFEHNSNLTAYLPDANQHIINSHFSLACMSFMAKLSTIQEPKSYNHEKMDDV